MDIADRIKTVRGDLSQEEFAQKLGVHKNSLGRYERKDSVPGVDVAEKICSIFGVSPAWLLFGSGPMRHSMSRPMSRPMSHEGEPAPSGVRDLPSPRSAAGKAAPPSEAALVGSVATSGANACPKCMHLLEKLVEIQGRENALLQENSALKMAKKNLEDDAREMRIEIKELKGRLSLCGVGDGRSTQVEAV